MDTWIDFARQEPELASLGKKLLFPSQSNVGYAINATLRRDGAPCLHPISVVLFREHLYTLMPPSSPKCPGLLRDGRFALQAFPPAENIENEEFYIFGKSYQVPDQGLRSALIVETHFHTEEIEVLFELLPERVMYTKLINVGTADERAIHIKWHN